MNLNINNTQFKNLTNYIFENYSFKSYYKNSPQSDSFYVISRSFTLTPEGEDLIDNLKKNDTPYLTNITQNPKVEEVNFLVEQIERNKAHTLIAVGGGSVLDAAKAASIAAYKECQIEDYLYGRADISPKKIQLILVPTTSGTGAEVSRGSILSDPQKNIKTGLRSDHLMANTAIIDPVLTVSNNYEITKICGFDVFSHAVETFISKKANWITKEKSLTAIKLVTNFLPLLLKNLDSLEYRGYLSYASFIAGQNLANSSTCLPHRLQYPIGAKTNTQHAAGVGALYPAWIKHCHPFATDKFNLIAHEINKSLNLDLKTPITISVENFLSSIGFNYRLTDLGITNKETCLELAGQVSGSMENDPSYSESLNLSQLYIDSI